MMKLMHKSQLIGTIVNPIREGMSMAGDLELTEAADRYLEMFAFLVGKKTAHEEPPYPESDLWGWTIEYGDGNVREIIGCPAVSNNGTIIQWRWGKQIN